MHPKSFFISLISLLLWTVPSFSQTKLIKGQVILHNSKSETGRVQFIPNTKITSPSVGNVYTDQKGRFKIRLKKIDTNKPLFLQVEKKGYEIVNLRDIKYLFLDKKPWLKIIVAKKGYVKRVRNTIMATVKESIMKEQTKLLELLSNNKFAAIPILENKFGRKINGIYEADELLSQLSRQIEDELRYTAYELVIVNPDDASDLYLNAMAHYRQGDFEMAIKTLQKERVEKLVDEIILDVEKLGTNQLQVNRLLESRRKEIELVKNNYIFQSIALQQTFKIREAAMALKKLKKVNDFAFTRKHNEIINRLNRFNIDESLNIDENVLLAERANALKLSPTHSHKKSQFQSVENNVQYEYQQKENFQPIKNNTPAKYQLKENSQFQSVGNSSPRKYQPTILDPSKPVPTPTQIIRNYERNNFSKEKFVKTETEERSNLTSNNVENNEPPNISHSVVNNGSTITITTTITTNGDGDINVSSDINEAGNVLTQIDSQSRPDSYEKLTAKGGAIELVQPSEQVKDSDFESIIFPIKNTASEFESFLNEKKKEVPKKWEQSNKYR